MSAMSTAPGAAYSSGIHTPPGYAFLSPINTWYQTASIALPPGIYLVSATATVIGGASISTITVRIYDNASAVTLAAAALDLAATQAVIALTPRRVVLPVATTIGLQGANATATDTQIAFAGVNCYLTAQICS